ncbi:MAG: serine/threonine-protein kinase, partial [Kiritimatiellae bacterium]|nr:serine/threonine-protein kinase [Kiritimatiellia bacterium]
MEGENASFIITDPVNSAACPKCGAVLDVSGLPAFALVQCPSCEFEFQVPAMLGPFRLLQMLGAGGMGGVYRARDEALKREVAIKVMLKKLGDDPQFVQTFQREAQAAARLNHPNIAQIYSFGQEKGQPYIVMELVSGGSLDQMITDQGAVAPAVVMHVGAQIADGLQEAANAGMVHGDVKPENILFDNDQNAK